MSEEQKINKPNKKIADRFATFVEEGATAEVAALLVVAEAIDDVAKILKNKK